MNAILPRKQVHVTSFSQCAVTLQPNKDPKIVLWLCFIDDIMGIYDGSPDELQNFVDDLNTVIPTIKFSLECSPLEINILDTKMENCGLTSTANLRTATVIYTMIWHILYTVRGVYPIVNY